MMYMRKRFTKKASSVASFFRRQLNGWH